MRPEEELKPLLDLGRARHVRGAGFQFRLPLAERLRAARRVPQAVVKVTSYASGKGQVARHLRYISRQGGLDLETDSGEHLTSMDDQRMLVEDWSADFDDRARSRDAVAIVFSMPPGSNAEALKGSVRATLSRSFPHQEWVFAVHEDRHHPHAHALVKMRGRESRRKLRLNKPELYRLRETFAKAAREQGVRLAASPRAARGVGQKGVRQAIYQLRLQGKPLDVDSRENKEASLELSKGPVQPKLWEEAMKQRHLMEQQAYRKEAESLRLAAGKKEGQDREKLLKAAIDLERFAQTLPKPKTRRQAWIEQRSSRDKNRPLPKRPISGSELEK